MKFVQLACEIGIHYTRMSKIDTILPIKRSIAHIRRQRIILFQLVVNM